MRPRNNDRRGTKGIAGKDCRAGRASGELKKHEIPAVGVLDACARRADAYAGDGRRLVDRDNTGNHDWSVTDANQWIRP
jgi:hypothetical protein